MLGLQNEREWAAFCNQVLGLPQLATDPRFLSNSQRTASREALRSIIVDVFANMTAAQVIERLDSAQIANARMNEMRDVWNHPQLKARGRWVEIDTPSGKVPALLPPGLPDTFAPRMDAVPAVGEHTDAILGELGYDQETIAQLRSEHAI